MDDYTTGRRWRLGGGRVVNPWAIAIIVAALILVVAMAVGSVCSLTSAPQPRRHPSHGNTEEES